MSFLRKVPCAGWLLMVSWGVALHPLLAADWPTYRGDSRRSGVATEGLTLPLHEVWVHQAAHAPQPAWPELPAKQDVWHRIAPLSDVTTYDRAYQVAVAGGSLFYGSSADDAVWCVDLSTGKTRWSFPTEGPVRLAPTVADGKVYAGSDDGFLYCLRADDGSLLWKHRAGPQDRRLPGNQRMISLWPVRCGIAVEGGVVYFCAGLFPCHGAYLCALDAPTGKELWTRPAEVSAQGYLVVSPTRLFVPTGRTTPRAFAREDGKDLGSLPGGGVDSRAGGCFAVLVGNQVVHDAGEDGKMQFSDAASAEKLISSSGKRLVADGPIAYILGNDRLCALDRAHFVELNRLQAKKNKTPDDAKRIAELGGDRKAYLKWEVPCAAPCELILAGQTLVAGGDSQVVAYHAADGKLLWTGTVTGRAHGLAASGGRLLVSTDRGTIHCFQSAVALARRQVVFAASKDPPASLYPEDDQTPLYRQAAEKAVQAVGPNRGYCLVLDSGIGRLAYEIARRSELHVIGLEADAAKAATARQLLAGAGLYGTRVTIHCGALGKVRYASYFANLITSDQCVVGGKLPADAAEVYRMLRPCGGMAVFIQPDGSADPAVLAKWGSAVAGWQVKTADGRLRVGMARRGPLEGAGQWSHLYADTGNSACSQDAMRQGPVDVQWFGRPGPRKMVDRHDKNVGPVYANGRLFVSGDDYVVAVDAYNGTVLWERDLPDSVRLGALKNCGNMAATDDALYVAAGGRCIAFDAPTGQQKAVFSAPAAPGGKKEWGYVASVDDILFGSDSRPGAAFRLQTLDTETLIWRDFKPVVCSDSLFAYNRHTGQRLWTYAPEKGVIVNPTIAIGGGRVYFVESTNPQTREVTDSRVTLDVLLAKGADLVALDMRSGKLLWKKPAGLEALQHVIFLSYAKEILLVTGTKNVGEGKTGRVRYDLCAFDAATGNRLWQNTQTPAPDNLLQGPHGEQVQHSAIVGETIYNTGFACNLRTGEPVAGWKWQKSGSCGTLSTSASCAFSRYANARMFDLASGEFTNLTTVARPGCWINVIPAGGLILIPEASAGCICGYPLQTSVALAPRSR